jgi:hypothetical protein
MEYPLPLEPQADNHKEQAEPFPQKQMFLGKGFDNKHQFEEAVERLLQEFDTTQQRGIFY